MYATSETKLTSFQRQLNLYGFRRLTKGEDQGCYFHPKFQRRRRDLLGEIKRMPIKGSLPTYDQLRNHTTKLPAERYRARRGLGTSTSGAQTSEEEMMVSPPLDRVETRASSQQSLRQHAPPSAAPSNRRDLLAASVMAPVHTSHVPISISHSLLPTP
ncbi:hypothetical protein EON64_04315, partial [archaeon]